MNGIGNHKLYARPNPILDRIKFVPYLQPKVKLIDRSICGYELLMRPAGHEAGAEEFYTKLRAGSAGNRRMVELSILEAALELLPFLPRAPVSLNVSWPLLCSSDGIELVELLVSHPSAPPITVEALEPDAVDYDTAIEVVQRIHRLRGRFAIDDFGKGFSQLALVASVPGLDEVKFDASIIHAANSAALLPSLVAAVHAVGATATAECVETASDAAKCRLAGFDQAQGYFFAKPVPFTLGVRAMN